MFSILFLLLKQTLSRSFGYYSAKKFPSVVELEGEGVTENRDIILPYDYIVVGGGAAGLSGAYTLAEKGKRVLLLERGLAREDHPMSEQLDGVGVLLNDLDSGDLDRGPVRNVTTYPSGILSHVGNVISGGTGVNMGILLYEDRDYWEQYAYDWQFPIDDMDAWMNAHEWVSDLLGSPVPGISPERDSLYDIATRKSLEEFYSQDGPILEQANSIIKPGRAWPGRTLFDYSIDGHPRRTLDLLLEKDKIPDTLNVVTNVEVLKVTTPSDGTFCVETEKRLSGSNVCPIIGNFPGIQWLFKCASTDVQDKVPTRYCIKRGDGYGVILAAGTLSSPLILMHSGIGPGDEVDTMSGRILSEGVGRNVTDRYMVFSSIYGYRTSPNQRVLTYAGLARLERPTKPMEFRPPNWGSVYKSSSISNLILGKSLVDRLSSYSESIFGNSLLSNSDYLFAPWEDMGGEDSLIGVGLATRTYFPPDVRDDPNIVLWGKIQAYCLDERWRKRHSKTTPSSMKFLAASEVSILDKFVMDVLCGVLEPTLECFRTSRAMFTMEPSPYSRGRIRLSEQNNSGIKVHMPYLDEEEDRLNIIESTKHLWKSIARIPEYQRMTSRTVDTVNCPFPIIGGLLSFLTGNLVDVDTMMKMKRAFGIIGDSVLDELPSLWRNQFLAGQKAAGPFRPKLMDSSEVISFLSGLENDTGLVGAAQSNEKSSKIAKTHPKTRALSRVIPWLAAQHVRSVLADHPVDETEDCDIPYVLRYRSLPPLPCYINDESAGAYILGYGMSLWHWLGSVRRSSRPSSPVNSDYEVRGVPGLYVIDASTLPHNPRMNPQVTVMANGRFAAETIMKSKIVDLKK
eukprot:GHVH01017099.1.p1 GENE.GHVH01017099.1~~GHVH01017099.1.p1  ORF type:complete len:850 (+),score=88.12 GHVH01017099.1:2743-5292(+)